MFLRSISYAVIFFSREALVEKHAYKIMDYEQLIRQAYIAFNARNIDAVLSLMSPDVKWPKAWEGDYAHGHAEVRAYWERQWKEINPIVTPVGFKERVDGTLAVEVDHLVKDLEGIVVFNGKVLHVYTIADGLIERMEIEMI